MRCAEWRVLYTLNVSGIVTRKLLPGDIISRSPADEHPAFSRNVKEGVMAGIIKLKTMPSDLTRYPQAERCVYLLLLSSQVNNRVINLQWEIFMRKMLIHILGIGHGFWPRNKTGSSGWCVLLTTSGAR